MTVRHLPGAPPGQRRCIADRAPGRTVRLVAVARDRTQTRSAAARGEASAVRPALSRGPPGRLRPGPSGHLWRIPAWTLSRPGRGRAERRATGQQWTGATSAEPRAASNASSLREMLFGLRETFEYHRCPSCGVMRIGSVPDDLGRHGQPSRASVRFLLRLPGIAAARSGLRPTIRRDGHSGSCRGEEEADTSRRRPP